VNLIAFLVGHGDAHAGQFVARLDPLHLFLVDHSTAFGSRPSAQMAPRQDPGELLVPSIPSSVARRVTSLRRHDVDALTRIETVDRGDALARARALLTGARPEPPRVIGLRRDEADRLWARVGELRERLADGRLGTF